MVVLAAAGPARAATRYASPSGTGDCSSPAAPCDIATAIGGAAVGDQVLVGPGTYTVAAPITTSAANLDIEGTGQIPGSFTPEVIDTTSTIQITGPGTTLRDLDIEDTGSGSGAALSFAGAVSERMIVRSGPAAGPACQIAPGALLRDSLCEQQGSGSAIEIAAAPGAEAVLRNVTAISTGGAAIDVNGSSSTAAMVINTIGRGGAGDIQASGAILVQTSHSNYRAAATSGGASVQDDGTSQVGSGDQTPAQLFMDPGHGNYREALGAQTIDAGVTDPANGTEDFDNDGRTLDPGNPCDSTDIGASQYNPSSGPAVLGGAARAIGRRSAKVAATSNPFGTNQAVHFDYGPAAHGGGPPARFSSTPDQCLPVANSPVPITVTLTNLLPATTYYFRAVSTNDRATTTPSFTSKFTTGPPPPRLRRVRQSRRRWFEPAGTTFSFALSEAASVRVVIEHAGKIVRKLVVAGHRGKNVLRYRGRLGPGRWLAPGTYTVVIEARNAFGERSAIRRLRFTVAGG